MIDHYSHIKATTEYLKAGIKLPQEYNFRLKPDQVRIYRAAAIIRWLIVAGVAILLWRACNG